MKEVYLKLKQIDKVITDNSDKNNYDSNGLYLIYNDSRPVIVNVDKIETENPTIFWTPLIFPKLFSKSDILDIEIEVLKKEYEAKIEALTKENESPKQNGCYEWVSAKTLKEIISIIKG